MSCSTAPAARVLPVLSKRQFFTDQTTSWVYIDLDVPGADGWGPYLESIQAETLTENATALFRWKIVFYWSLDGRNWTGPVDLFSEILADGSVVQTAYSTSTQLGLQMRYAVAVANQAGSSIVESGTLSCALTFNFKT